MMIPVASSSQVVNPDHLESDEPCYDLVREWRFFNSPWGVVLYPYWVHVEVDC